MTSWTDTVWGDYNVNKTSAGVQSVPTNGTQTGTAVQDGLI